MSTSSSYNQANAAYDQANAAYDQAKAALEHATAQGKHVKLFIAGPAGIGKTTIRDKLIRELYKDGEVMFIPQDEWHRKRQDEDTDEDIELSAEVKAIVLRDSDPIGRLNVIRDVYLNGPHHVIAEVQSTDIDYQGRDDVVVVQLKRQNQ